MKVLYNISEGRKSMSKKWTNVCTQCRKSGGNIRTTSNGAPPTGTVTSIGGSCPCTPDKKHRPKWTPID